MKKIGLLAIFLGGLLGGVAFAQTPEGYYRERLALPEGIRALLDNNKAKEAVAEYEQFKKTVKADALDMLFLDARVYGQAAYMEESNATYGKLRDEAIKKMVAGYPDDSDVILYTLPEEDNPEKALEIISKAIEADPEYLPLYEVRCRIYLAKGNKAAACQDYAKLPEEAQIGLLEPGTNCDKELGVVKK